MYVCVGGGGDLPVCMCRGWRTRRPTCLRAGSMLSHTVVVCSRGVT